MKISWFPGHMKKALRTIGEHVALVDLVLIVIDARIPVSSRNMELEEAIKGKSFLYILNKADLSEKQATKKWLDVFRSEGNKAVSVSSKSGSGVSDVFRIIENRRAIVIEKKRSKQRIDENIRLMVIGIPNVGKSTLINRICGRNSVKVGKKPGVTRGKQWISASRNIEILDMPGIFYPRIESEDQAWRLAALGAIKEEFIPVEDVAVKIIELLIERKHTLVGGIEESQFQEDPTSHCQESLKKIALRQGFVKNEGYIDMRRLSFYIIKSLREGVFGPLTLEYPSELVKNEKQ